MYPCEIKELAAQHTVAIRFRTAIEDLPAAYGKAFDAVMAYLSEAGEEHGEFAYGKYFNMDMQNLDVEAGFPVSAPLPGKDNIFPGIIPSGTYAICHYTGPYADEGPAFEELTRFIREKGYEQGLVFYEWYLNGPDVPPEELKTDLVFPVYRVAEPTMT
jgi:effector-binding domain-containing protein